jgi:acyl carrier protein
VTDAARQMIEFISSKVLRGRRAVDEHTPLVSSGLIDSLAQTELVLKLEEVTGKRFGPGSISPEDLETVGRMLDAAARR